MMAGQGQAQAPHRLKAIPQSSETPLNKQILQDLSEVQLQAVLNYDAETASSFEPLADGLRAAFLAIPGVREAFTKRPSLRPLQRTPALKELDVRPPDIHVVDTAEFFTATNEQVISGTPWMGEHAKPNGDFGADIQVTDGEVGIGQCWAAVGQAFLTPGRGQLVCSSTGGVGWQCKWDSFFWRLAAGNVWIGQVVNLFDPGTGKLIQTPVAYTNKVYSYQDWNLSDWTTQRGGASLHLTTLPVYCPDVIRAECWVWIGAYGNANGFGSGDDRRGGSDRSHVDNSIDGTLTSLVLDFWSV